MRWIDGFDGIIGLARLCKVNIASWYHCATIDEKFAGSRWYWGAYDQAVALQEEFELPSVKAAAGFIAALSPQQPWTRNVDIARSLLQNPLRSVHYARQIDKAQRCSQLLACDKLSDILRGRKELSFARNIANPTDAYTVTVDGFSAHLALGTLVDSKLRAAYALKLSGVYTAIADAYRAVGRRYRVLPSTVQATTWLQWRTHHQTRHS